MSARRLKESTQQRGQSIGLRLRLRGSSVNANANNPRRMYRNSFSINQYLYKQDLYNFYTVVYNSYDSYFYESFGKREKTIQQYHCIIPLYDPSYWSHFAQTRLVNRASVKGSQTAHSGGGRLSYQGFQGGEVLDLVPTEVEVAQAGALGHQHVKTPGDGVVVHLQLRDGETKGYMYCMFKPYSFLSYREYMACS